MAEHDALPLVVLTEQFAKLPGIGMKSAARLAYHVMSMDAEEVEEFAQALLNAKRTVHYCRICENLTDQELCPVCDDPTRDHATICVVEQPKDIAAFELEEGKRESRAGCEDDGHDDGCDADEQAVQIGVSEVAAVEDFGEILQHPAMRQRERRGLCFRFKLERRQRHPEERIGADEQHDKQKSMP